MIRDAAQKDIPEILAIYQSAKLALAAAGVDQWQDDYPNEASLQEDLAAGISRVAIVNGQVVATAAAYVGTEPTYEKIENGAWKTNNHAYGLVHRIAVCPTYKKGGVASALLHYTRGLAIAAGARSLRCDTHRDNTPMQHTLLKNGYTYCGLIYLADGSERFAYELVL